MGQMSGQVADKTTPELELELELELERELKKDNIPKKTRKNFKKPTLKEVESYCIERKNSIDAQSFLDFYESKGWMIGKNKMKDWKAAVRTWEKNSFSSKKTTKVFGKGKEQEYLDSMGSW